MTWFRVQRQPNAGLARLFGRSRTLRRQRRLIALVTLALVAMLTCTVWLDLTPAQQAERDLGRFDAMLYPGKQLAPGQNQVDLCSEAIMVAGAESCVSFLSYPLSFTELTRRETTVLEGPWHEEPYPESFSLREGRWPTSPNEVVLPLSFGVDVDTLTAADGAFLLSVVGTYVDDFHRDGGSILVAQGTWAASSGQLDLARFPSLLASASYGWTGDNIDESAVAESLGQPGDQPLALNRRMDYSTAGAASLSSLAFFGIFPVVAIPSMTGLVSGVLSMRWRQRITESLWRQGIGGRASGPAFWKAGLLSAFGSALIGYFAGFLVALCSRPVLDQWSRQPLAPPRITWLVMVAVAMGVALGFSAGVLLTRPMMGNRSFGSRHGRLARRSLAVVSAGWLLWRLPGTQGPDDVVINTALLVVLLSLVVPEATRIVGGVPWREPRSQLAMRVLARQPRRLAATGSGLALAICLATASTTALQMFVQMDNQALSANLPPGYVTLGTLRDAPVPSAVRSEFEDFTGLIDPIVVSRFALDQHGAPGVIASVTSVEELERLAGTQLDKAARSAILNGGALVREPTTITVASGESVSLPVTVQWYPRSLPFGALILDVTASTNGWTAYREGFFYPEATQRQVELAAQAHWRLGFEATFVDWHRPADQVTLTIPHLAGLAGFASLIVLLVGSFSMSQAREMRPYLARLHAVGVSHRWVQSVVRRQTMLVLAPPILAGALAAAFTISSLMVFNEAELGIPWSALGLLALSLALGTRAGVAVGTRKLRSAERLQD